jgi:hypothetical protein
MRMITRLVSTTCRLYAKQRDMIRGGIPRTLETLGA